MQPDVMCSKAVKSLGQCPLWVEHAHNFLQALEPLEEIGLHLVDGEADVDGRDGGFERASFHVEIGLDVQFERLEMGVPEDVLDGHRADASL